MWFLGALFPNLQRYSQVLMNSSTEMPTVSMGGTEGCRFRGCLTSHLQATLVSGTDLLRPLCLLLYWHCCLLLCLTSQQQASVSQGRICSDNFMCCHTEIKVADPTFHLTQSQCTDTRPTSPSTDPITTSAWQGSHWSASFKSLVWLDPGQIPGQAGLKPGIFRSRGGCLNH